MIITLVCPNGFAAGSFIGVTGGGKPHFNKEAEMKIRNVLIRKQKGVFKQAQEITEAAVFHANRLIQTKKIQTKRDSSNKPEGNYDYEQMVAEDIVFNTKAMIAEAAYFIAKRRGFVAGNEISDWLQAEIELELSLHNAGNDRHRRATDNRLNSVSLKR